ncbi:MAG: hypothetical protein V3T43_02760 [Nitrosomonadaceae bacterium]
MKTPPDVLRLIKLRRKAQDANAHPLILDRIQANIRKATAGMLEEGIAEAEERIAKASKTITRAAKGFAGASEIIGRSNEKRH